MIDNTRTFGAIILFALLLGSIGYVQSTGIVTNQTNVTNISYYNNATYNDSDILKLIKNDTYFNGTVFPLSTNFRNDTMYNYFESGKVNKSGDMMSGTLKINSSSNPLFLRRSGGAGGMDVGIDSYISAYARDVRFTVLPDAPSSDIGGFQFATHNGISGDILALNITYSGSLTAGNIQPSAQSNALCYNKGTGLITYNSGITTCAASNESLKTNITPIIGNITPFVMALQPIKYKLAFENTNEYHVGFSAQSVKNVLIGTPYQGTLIGYNPDGSVSGLRYEETIPFLVKVIQEQQTTINKICTNYPTACR